MQTPSLQPKVGYVLEIDGKVESAYVTLMGALKAGFELRQKFPNSQVTVHDVDERTRTPVDEHSAA
jgi:hypothetical protein